MNYSHRLSLSYYKTIATLNKEHQIYLVQHQETGKIFIKKILDIYNAGVYQALLNHSLHGIPQVIEIHEENEQLTVIESYISGITLQELLDTNNLALQDIVHYGLELCHILKQLHTMTPPIIHRDIKPSNIIVTEYNHLVLLDFNAAKFYSPASESDTVLLGTKGYAAPEQYGFGSSSPQTDIYSLGILLGKLNQSLKKPSQKLAAIIHTCTELNPADRYRSVTELTAALEEFSNSKMTSDDSTPKKKNVRSRSSITFALPGFRSRTPWKILVAVPSYLMLFFLSYTLEVEGASESKLIVERIFAFLCCFSIILVSFDYMNIKSLFPLCSHESKPVRTAATVMLSFAILFILFLLMFTIEGIFHM